MNFASRIAIARHGFQTVAHHLAGEYEHYREIGERHGIEISGERLRTVVEDLDAGALEGDVSAWRRLLDGTTGVLLRQSHSSSA
jgi:NTE family protein